MNFRRTAFVLVLFSAVCLLSTRAVAQKALHLGGRDQFKELHPVGVVNEIEHVFGIRSACVPHDAVEDAARQPRIILVPEHEVGKRDLPVVYRYVGNERHALHKDRLHVLTADDDSGILKSER